MGFSLRKSISFRGQLLSPSTDSSHLTVATTGSAGEIVFDPIADLEEWTAAAGNTGEIVATSVGGGTEFLYHLKSLGGDWTRATGSSPITITGLDAGAVYEFVQGDGTIAEVSAGVDTTAVTVGTAGNPGEIIFNPIAPLDNWTATTGNAGEIILEAA
jgi:hypothetical protein